MCVGVGDKREKGDDRSGNNEEEQNSTHQNSEEEEKRDRPDIPYREEEGAELQQKTKLRKTKVESNETQDCQPGKTKNNTFRHTRTRQKSETYPWAKMSRRKDRETSSQDMYRQLRNRTPPTNRIHWGD